MAAQVSAEVLEIWKSPAVVERLVEITLFENPFCSAMQIQNAFRTTWKTAAVETFANAKDSPIAVFNNKLRDLASYFPSHYQRSTDGLQMNQRQKSRTKEWYKAAVKFIKEETGYGELSSKYGLAHLIESHRFTIPEENFGHPTPEKFMFSSPKIRDFANFCLYGSNRTTGNRFWPRESKEASSELAPSVNSITIAFVTGTLRAALDTIHHGLPYNGANHESKLHRSLRDPLTQSTRILQGLLHPSLCNVQGESDRHKANHASVCSRFAIGSQ